MHFSVSFILLTQVRNLFMCTTEINLKLSLARNLLNIDLITCKKVLTKRKYFHSNSAFEVEMNLINSMCFKKLKE